MDPGRFGCQRGHYPGCTAAQENSVGELERLGGGGLAGVEGPRHKSFYESLLLPHKVAFPRDLDLFKKKGTNRKKMGFHI